MGYNLKNGRGGGSASRILEWPSLGTLELESGLYDGLNFGKVWRICVEDVAGEQGLALRQLFPCRSSYSFRDSDRRGISFFDDGGLKLGHFCVSDMLFPFLAFVEL